MHINQVITKNYPENLKGGFMVCGINYGYSELDEERDNAGTPVAVDPPSFFSDSTIRKNDKFKNRILKWLKGWGLELVTAPGGERAFERAFFQCNWLDSQTRGAGVISNTVLVNEADGFVNLLAQRKPSVIFLFGVKLIEALNDSRIRPKVIAIFGERTDPESIPIPNYSGTGLRVQKFGGTVVISSPHPHPRSRIKIKDEYMANVKLPTFAMETLKSPL